MSKKQKCPACNKLVKPIAYGYFECQNLGCHFYEKLMSSVLWSKIQVVSRDTVLDFGKYKGIKISRLLSGSIRVGVKNSYVLDHIEYLFWALENIDSFTMSMGLVNELLNRESKIKEEKMRSYYRSLSVRSDPLPDKITMEDYSFRKAFTISTDHY